VRKPRSIFLISKTGPRAATHSRDVSAARCYRQEAFRIVPFPLWLPAKTRRLNLKTEALVLSLLGPTASYLEICPPAGSAGKRHQRPRSGSLTRCAITSPRTVARTCPERPPSDPFIDGPRIYRADDCPYPAVLVLICPPNNPPVLKLGVSTTSERLSVPSRSAPAWPGTLRKQFAVWQCPERPCGNSSSAPADEITFAIPILAIAQPCHPTAGPSLRPISRLRPTFQNHGTSIPTVPSLPPCGALPTSSSSLTLRRQAFPPSRSLST